MRCKSSLVTTEQWQGPEASDGVKRRQRNSAKITGWKITHSRGHEGVPASWPLCWHGPEISYASYSLACSFLDGKGPSALYTPHCTCPEMSISWNFNPPHKPDLQPKWWLAFLHKPPSRIFWSLWTCRQSPPIRSTHTSALVPALFLLVNRGE